MSDEAIPEDAEQQKYEPTEWAIAEQLAIADGFISLWAPPKQYRNWFIRLARAILAERERCAKTAEDLPLTELHRWGVDSANNPKLAWQLGAETQRTAITYAIRSSS